MLLSLLSFSLTGDRGLQRLHYFPGNWAGSQGHVQLGLASPCSPPPTSFCHESCVRRASFTSGETKSPLASTIITADYRPTHTKNHLSPLVPRAARECRDATPHGLTPRRQWAGPDGEPAPAPPCGAHHRSVVLLQSRGPDHLAQEPPVAQRVLLPLETLVE